MAAPSPRKAPRKSAPRKASAPTPAKRPARARGPVAAVPDDETLATAGELEDFEYTTKAGDVIVLPPFVDVLDSGMVRKARKQSEVDQMFSLLESVLPDVEGVDGETETDPTLAILDGLKLPEFFEVMEAWQRHSDITLGE